MVSNEIMTGDEANRRAEREAILAGFSSSSREVLCSEWQSRTSLPCVGTPRARKAKRGLLLRAREHDGEVARSEGLEPPTC